MFIKEKFKQQLTCYICSTIILFSQMHTLSYNLCEIVANVKYSIEGAFSNDIAHMEKAVARNFSFHQNLAENPV